MPVAAALRWRAAPLIRPADRLTWIKAQAGRHTQPRMMSKDRRTLDNARESRVLIAHELRGSGASVDNSPRSDAEALESLSSGTENGLK